MSKMESDKSHKYSADNLIKRFSLFHLAGHLNKYVGLLYAIDGIVNKDTYNIIFGSFCYSIGTISNEIYEENLEEKRFSLLERTLEENKK